VLPFHKLNEELFCPTRKENVETTGLCDMMAWEIADCMLQELRDETKATSDYLSSVGGEFS